MYVPLSSAHSFNPSPAPPASGLGALSILLAGW